jgi:hypothetical protein
MGSARETKVELFDVISDRNETAKTVHPLEGLCVDFLLSFFLLHYYIL